MKGLYWRFRYVSLVLAAGGLFAFTGCGLSDRQLATIWQSVISTGLNTLVGNLITSAVETAQGTS